MLMHPAPSLARAAVARAALFLLICLGAGSAIAQPLEIIKEKTDRAYFAYDGEPLLSFGGLSDFMFWFADDAHKYRLWADWAASHGMNHIRAYPPLSWKHSVRVSRANGGTAANVRLPYRVVRGSIAGGNPQFDLRLFNESFWAEFRERLEYLQAKGIIVHLLMWNNWQLRDADTNPGNDIDWDGHVFNPRNNVNSSTEDLVGSNRTDFFHSVADGRTSLANLQRAFFTKLIEETYDLDNVYYDLVHELAEHQGNWPKTQVWINNMVQAIRSRWIELRVNRELILGMDTGGLSSTQRNWIFTRPWFDVLIDGKVHKVANAKSWRQKYDKPYIPQEAWDDNSRKYSYGITDGRIHMRKYFWKFMMTKSQQLDVYTWIANRDPRRFDYNPNGHNAFENDARVLRAFWRTLVDYPNLWFKGSISPSLDTNHRYVLSSDREAVAYISSRTGQQGRTFSAGAIQISGTTLSNGTYRVDIVKPDKHTDGGLLKRISNVRVNNGALTVQIPTFKDDVVVHVY
jgi:hypothetical protein